MLSDQVYMSMIKSNFHVEKRQLRNFYMKPHELNAYKYYEPNLNIIDQRIRELNLKLKPTETKNSIHLNEDIANKIKKTLEQKVLSINSKLSKENMSSETKAPILKKTFANHGSSIAGKKFKDFNSSLTLVTNEINKQIKGNSNKVLNNINQKSENIITVSYFSSFLFEFGKDSFFFRIYKTNWQTQCKKITHLSCIRKIKLKSQVV